MAMCSASLTTLFDISDHEFNLLYRACEGHPHERTHPGITIQTCRDSDRLDLGRVLQGAQNEVVDQLAAMMKKTAPRKKAK